MSLDYLELESWDGAGAELGHFLKELGAKRTTVLFAVSESLPSKKGGSLREIIARMSQKVEYFNVNFIGFNADVGGELMAMFKMTATPSVAILRNGRIVPNTPNHFGGEVSQYTLEMALEVLNNPAREPGGSSERQAVSAQA